MTLGPGLKLVRKLGQGGSSSTYVVTDAQGQQSALKLLHLERLSDWKALEMFERQHSLLRGLDHPGIPKVYGLFELSIGGLERKALHQELIQGINLRDGLQDGALRFDEPSALTLLDQLLDAVQYLHSHSPPILHRDIKPSNIIIRPDKRPVLIDFDTASGLRQDPSKGDNTMVGTAGFVPLEQLAGMACEASDLYALGMTLICVLTQREITSLPLQQLRVQFEPFVNISAPFIETLKGMTQPDVALRLASVAQVREALSNAPSQAAAQALAMRTQLPKPGDTPPPKKTRSLATQADVPATCPFDKRFKQGLNGKPHGSASREEAAKSKKGSRSHHNFKDRDQFSWAIDASSHSNYGGSWDIKNIKGPPDVFPRHGDIAGAWAQHNTRTGVVSLDLRFGQDRPQAQALWVLETYNAGAVFAAATFIDEQWHLIWAAEPDAKLPERAHILKIEVPPGLDGEHWRLWLHTTKVDGYNEIDAVALVCQDEAQRQQHLAARVPLHVGGPFDPKEGFNGERVGQAQHLRPAEVEGINFKADPRFSWAKNAHASSNYGGSWDVKTVTGPPDVFPKHGDIPGAWAQKSEDRGIEWLNVSFKQDVLAIEIWIFETCNPGYVFAVSTRDAQGQHRLLWQDELNKPESESRALLISLAQPYALDNLTLWLDRTSSYGYNEIDAVGVVGQLVERAPAKPKPTPTQQPKTDLVTYQAPQEQLTTTSSPRRKAVIIGSALLLLLMLVLPLLMLLT